MMTIPTPLMIMVAPNGARRTQADHPAVPITPAELATTAAACVDAGASVLHLHVRDRHGQHILDAPTYRDALATIRRQIGDRLVIQVTTEAVGRYTPAQQMALVRDLKPEAVSLALRELIPDADSEAPAAVFLHWLHQERIWPQYILYSVEEVRHFDALRTRGIIPSDAPSVLFVLGRYAHNQQSQPSDLVPFVSAWQQATPWCVCAFGAQETACVVAAMALGGHGRVGFENNLRRPDGTLAADNAERVAQIAAAARLIGRPLLNADGVRAQFIT